MRTRRRSLWATFLVVLPGFALASADDGISPDKVRVGQAAPLKGPAEALGQGMQAGLNAAFHRINQGGGVNGRKIELKSVNDGYEPAKCAQMVRMLIEKAEVFAIIGGVGTPTSRAAVPICDEAMVPFIAPFTGTQFLRMPFNRNVVNLRASYHQEIEAIVKHLVDDCRAKSVACFYQKDASGQTSLDGITKALEARSMKLAATGAYERNTIAISEAISTIAAAKPDAIVMFGTYKPCAEFIKVARKRPELAATKFCNISFVGSDALLKELGPASEGVLVSQVVPSPWDEAVPVVKQYLEDMKASGNRNQIGYVSLEGYLAGRLFTEVLARIEGEPTREKFISTLETTGAFDLGGFRVAFGPGDHEGSDAVFMTVFEGGKVVAVTSQGLAASAAIPTPTPVPSATDDGVSERP